MVASQEGQSEVVQMLLLAGVNKEAATKVGCRDACPTLGLRAVLCPCLGGDALGCKSDGGFVLLQNGWTALMLASDGGHSEVPLAQMLLLAGVNKDAATTVSYRGACHTLGLRAVVCL